MKIQKFYFLAAFFLLVFSSILIYSCKKNHDAAQKSSDNVLTPALLQAAEDWHSLQTTQSNSKLNDVSQANAVLSPDWSNAKLQKLKNGHSLIVVAGPNPIMPDKASHTGMLRKFVFGTDGEKIKGGIIVEIYGDKDYLLANKDNLIENYNDNVLGDFTGVVIFYDVNYRLIFSDVIKNGKRVNAKAAINFDNGQHLNPTMKQVDATTLSTCLDWYLVTYYANGTETWDYMYTTCTSSGGGETGSGGGGGGAPPGYVNPAQTPNSPGDHPLKNGHLPGSTTQTQLQNTCVFYSMSYVASFFNKSLDPIVLVINYSQEHDQSTSVTFAEGVPPQNLIPFISEYFNVVATQDVIGSINSNLPLLAVVNATHEVFITGYNNDGTYEYFDSVTGSYQREPGNHFSQVVKVTGSK